MNIKEITELTKLPEGTVKSRLLYAKKYLRMEIEQYEQRSGEAITFQGRSLEAALAMLGTSLIAQPKVMIPFTQIEIPSFAWSLAVKSALVLLLGTGIIATAHTLNDHAQSSMEHSVVTQRKFPAVIYRNREITTPREAYKVLLDFADCDVEMRDKTDAEMVDIFPVYAALMEYGEGYAELLQRRDWDLLFENYN